MKAREYDVLVRAVEEGAALGYRHAFKHTAAPSTEAVEEAIVLAVLNAVCEVFDFAPDEPEA